MCGGKCLVLCSCLQPVGGEVGWDSNAELLAQWRLDLWQVSVVQVASSVRRVRTRNRCIVRVLLALLGEGPYAGCRTVAGIIKSPRSIAL